MRLLTDTERAAVRRASGITARRIAYRLRAIVTHGDHDALKLWGALASEQLVQHVSGRAVSLFYFHPALLRAAFRPADRMTAEFRASFEAP